MLKRLQFVGFAEYRCSKFRAIDAVSTSRSGKTRLNGVEEPAARPLQGAHGGIGIEYRHTGTAEHG